MPGRVRQSLPLLLAAVIWGFAFVAQRVGMEFVGPFTFNAVRFALGGLSLLPVAFWLRRDHPSQRLRLLLGGGALLGLGLFGGASVQQMGLVFTTAGKAGFITGLYVVLTPLLGLVWGQRTGWNAWLGVLLAVLGLYLLTVEGPLTLSRGDGLVLAGAFFWAIHVQLTGWLVRRLDALWLSVVQFAVCALLSTIAAWQSEPFSLDGLLGATPAILYGGLLSVGVAYTLQVVGQKKAPPTLAAVLLSLETVFAALGGWLILGEVLTERALWGCAAMFAGMLISQLELRFAERSR